MTVPTGAVIGSSKKWLPSSVSLAIPIYNEEPVVPELVRRTAAVLDTLPGGPHEIVFVNDGSSDGTLGLLEAAAERDPRIVVVELSRNFGHQTASPPPRSGVRGRCHSHGRGPPGSPRSHPYTGDHYRQGYDVVYVRRVNRKEPWWLRMCYYVFYRLLATLSSIELPLDSGDFGLMSRRVVDEIRRMPEHHRYLRGLRTWVGFSPNRHPVERAARHAGRTSTAP